MRSGIITKKLGMSAVYTEDGVNMPVTVLQIDNCQVVGHRTEEKDGYKAVQLGAGVAKVKNVTKSVRGRYVKAKVEPKRKLAEFRVTEDALIDIGAQMTAEHFVIGQYVDVVGTTKGKGFAGGMKRHGFSGLRASHGVSINHRSLGSTGQCQDPGKVFKGKKMAGQLGDVRVTQQNLEVISTDVERGLIILKGSVPGAKGGYIMVRDAKKHPIPSDVTKPTTEPTETEPTENESNESIVNVDNDAIEETEEVVTDASSVKNNQVTEDPSVNDAKSDDKD